MQVMQFSTDADGHFKNYTLVNLTWLVQEIL